MLIKWINEVSNQIEQHPDDAQAYADRGEFRYARKEYALALEDMRKAQQLKPIDPEYHCGLGAVLCAIGDHDAALAAFAKGIDLAPSSMECLLRKAECLAKMGRTADVLQTLDALSTAGVVEDFGFYKQRGLLFLAVGRLSDAQGDLLRSIKIFSYDPEAHFRLGEVCMGLGKIHDAIEAFSNAIKINAEIPEFYAMRATAYERDGKHEMAAKDLEALKALSENK